ncbi:PIG-L family deacetylase [Xenophilus arseniciresistens]|uniref:PIG-L family deacetylase n=1 Tax=Xenophilus arseniciresistens TaxID=1283306 RepID=A0AAE3N6V5_9BURK|nr:PIG-L family deacetylase [Xenophilus arseniciresistens]MDA7415032.1 PIG-L family deacetylase [Xenophilus arseniciresistens]
MDRFIHAGQATPEARWLACEALRTAPAIHAAELVPAGHRAVVLAPHPDDEVLAVGGLIRQLARLQRTLCVLAVTDGEASHPGSSCWPAGRLAATRAREQGRALRVLGVPAPVQRLGFPDGGVAPRQQALAEALRRLLQPNDIVFTTWRLDGHPDHEATGAACADATARCGAQCVEVPVWGWHWSRPEDAPMPWPRARRLALDAQDLRAKQLALRAFRTQLRPDPSTGAAPILDAASRARAARPFELLFV